MHRIVVFIDQWLPFHSDAQRNCGKNPFIDPREYYGKLRKFFKTIKYETVIAAHKASRFKRFPSFARGYKWVKGNTEELIKKSSLVLVHNSKAIKYAAKYKKPLIFLNLIKTDTTKWFTIEVEKRAKEYGKIPICIG